MIDPHVHLRDWNQKGKETLRHGLSVAWSAGLDAVFEMPNTDPPLTSRDVILRRIDEADAVLASLRIPLFHGLYAGITAVPAQIEEAVAAWRDLFPRVVGLKMYAGHSTGEMGVVEREAQAVVYKILTGLGYSGVLAVHCEKQSLLRPGDWNPQKPASHARARPPAAEVASVDDQRELALEAGFPGVLHVCHISTPWALDVLRARHAPAAGDQPDRRPLRVTCGLTPHHALLDAGMMADADGLLLLTNPPLRPLPMPSLMLEHLCDGSIDWIETDHAPHTRRDKTQSFACGIPGLPYYPRFVVGLAHAGVPGQRIDQITHDAICRVFGLTLENRRRKGDTDLAGEYEFDPFAAFRG
ncbi:MAG TPA: dihydroorotase [Spirochaetia bacterium]|nr:dihydroorotase [Spirochaetia bacterium]